jgi:hypothetical protein
MTRDPGLEEFSNRFAMRTDKRDNVDLMVILST